ncbi:MAG: aminoglycoside phosphotransferase family protein [Ardenticatenaceae bacterium]|nr:aminoglycoside phosphotransferase family protein [Ardenticatenaceae bacterium]
MSPDEIQTKIDRVRPHFPNLNFDRTQVNEEGLAHQVLIVDQQRVFRFPMDDWARASLKQEVKVLEVLGHDFPVSLPAYDYIAEDVVSYPFLPGQAFTRHKWLACSPDEQRSLAGQVGEMLAVMHRISPSAREVSDEGIGPSLTVRTQQDWETLYWRARKMLYPLLPHHAQAWVDDHFSYVVDQPEFMEYNPVLMNGDIGTYHMLFDDQAKSIVGVIDFGTAGWGDPACDLGCLLYQYGESFVRQLADVYPAAADQIDRARFWAGTLEIQWALGGLRSMKEKDITTDYAPWSWFTVHIGFGAKDIMPIGTPL